MAKAKELEQFILLRAEGQSYQSIANALKVSKTTCLQWGRVHQEAIAEARRMYIDALEAQYSMTIQNRVQSLGTTLERIHNAIEQADLNQLPIDKLLKLELEYQEKLHTMLCQFKRAEEANAITKDFFGETIDNRDKAYM